MSKKNNEGVYEQEIRNDGGLITGAALVGGTKLAYEAGKDLYTWLKPEQKIFVQLLSSASYERDHLVKARFASAYVQAIYINSVSLKKQKPGELQMYKIYASDGYGYGDYRFDGEERLVTFPYLLSPGGVLDVYLKIPEQTDPKVIKAGGTHLVCEYSALDRLGDGESLSVPVRLCWAGGGE